MIAGEVARQGRWRDTLLVVAFAFVARVLIIAWAGSRFPPAADGQFYDVVARRISMGLGYTWLWPDGAVTYAAHYPVGYPAILGGLYALVGASAAVAMWLNGLCGVVTTLVIHRIALRIADRRAAFGAAVVGALHPTLLGYTPAMMTELVTAALLAGAVALTLLGPVRGLRGGLNLAVVGLLCGIMTLVRPQQVLWAPLLGVVAIFCRTNGDSWRWRRLLLSGALTTTVAVGVCLPWTLRNCDKMERCVFVSANGGWNLYIGTSPIGGGAWASIDSIGVPRDCRTVFQEAAKDACFGQAGRRLLMAHPWAWVQLIPAKLSKTFDEVGAPGYYLNASNRAAFGDSAKWWLGASEVLVQRLCAIAAALALYRSKGPRQSLRHVLAACAIVATLAPLAWVGALLFCAGAVTLGRRLQGEPAILILGMAYGMTAAVHAVFFGGNRYLIGVLPLVLVGAAQGLVRRLPERVPSGR